MKAILQKIEIFHKFVVIIFGKISIDDLLSLR